MANKHSVRSVSPSHDHRTEPNGFVQIDQIHDDEMIKRYDFCESSASPTSHRHRSNQREHRVKARSRSSSVQLDTCDDSSRTVNREDQSNLVNNDSSLHLAAQANGRNVAFQTVSQMPIRVEELNSRCKNNRTGRDRTSNRDTHQHRNAVTSGQQINPESIEKHIEMALLIRKTRIWLNLPMLRELIVVDLDSRATLAELRRSLADIWPNLHSDPVRFYRQNGESISLSHELLSLRELRLNSEVLNLRYFY